MDHIWLWQCKVEATTPGLMTSICQLAALQVANHLVTVVYIEVKQEAGHSGDAQQEGMAFFFEGSCSRGVHVFMADPQTSFAANSKQDAVMHVA